MKSIPDAVFVIDTRREAIAVAEKQHEKRYNELRENIENGSVFKKDKPVTWRCRNCGYLHAGAEAPDKCPACVKPQGAFYLFPEVSAHLNGNRTAEDLAAMLLKKAGVAVVPGEAFGSPDNIRLSYASSMENLEKALARIGEVFSA
mgnify:CR=1 FL=1